MSSFEQHQAATARWMGYPDAAGMNADHDDLHRALCRWLGVTSHAMRIAAGESLSREDHTLANLEEDAVMYLQKFMRHAGAKVPQ